MLRISLILSLVNTCCNSCNDASRSLTILDNNSLAEDTSASRYSSHPTSDTIVNNDWICETSLWNIAYVKSGKIQMTYVNSFKSRETFKRKRVGFDRIMVNVSRNFNTNDDYEFYCVIENHLCSVHMSRNETKGANCHQSNKHRHLNILGVLCVSV